MKKAASKKSLAPKTNKKVSKKKKESSKSSKNIVVTAALPYANGAIHIGHLLEYIQADIFSRFLKLTGNNALYICASDMHGTPIEVNAKKANLPPEQFVEKYWKEHQEDFKSFQINFDNYYKTHSPENKEVSEYFYNELKKQGKIYRKKILALYCSTCKRYLPDRFVKGECSKCHALDQYGDVCEKCSSVLKGNDLINPYCIECKNKPIQKESKHYFFKLSDYSKPLLQWITSKQANIQPEIKNSLLEWLEKGLEDWCISRDGPYFCFEIPNSKKETGETKYFYVWLDAPIGYISSTKNYTDKHKQDWKDYWHKGQVYHFIGKDIAYFHFLFWPAELLGLKIPLPELTVHGFITVNGQKMSKSRGTFLTAKDFLKLFPAQSLRFYYASHLDRKVIDVDLNYQDLQAVNNSVLMGNLANFCYRTLTFAQKNYGEITTSAKNKELEDQIKPLTKQIKQNYQTQDFKSAVKNILKISDLGNSYFQKLEPWKNKEDKQIEAGVTLCVNIAKDLAILTSPILPEFSQKITRCLRKEQLTWNDLSKSFKGKLEPIELLVEKIERVPDMKPQQPVSEITYSVVPAVQELGVKVRVATISNVEIKKKKEPVEKLKKEIEQKSKHHLQSIIAEYENIDKKSNVDSNQNPTAVKNLLTLVENKGHLPNINSIVDIYNAISLDTGIAMATHDLAKIASNLQIRLSNSNEPFTAIDSKKEILKAGEVIYSDSKQVLGRFSRQCQETSTTLDTKNVLLVAFGNAKISDEQMDSSIKQVCDLITQHNGGTYALAKDTFPYHLLLGKIEQVTIHPQAPNLFLLKVNFGSRFGLKQIVTNLKKPQEEFLNQTVAFCLNLKPIKLRGELSEGMIIAAEDSQNICFIKVENGELGDELQVEGLAQATTPIVPDDFKRMPLIISKNNIFYQAKRLNGPKGPAYVKGIKEGSPVF